jgi:drug/metabolite transporter (DMT)-like permease
MARVGLALVAATYGSNYPFVKLMDTWVGTPAEAAALRFSIAALVALPTLAYLARTAPHLMSWSVAGDGLTIGALSGAGYAAQSIALRTSSASVQAFLASLSAIVVPVLNFVVNNSRQSVRVWVAAWFALAGVGCVQGQHLASAWPAAGDAIGLLQPIFFGSAYFVCGSAISRRRLAEPGSALPVCLTCWSLLAVFAFAAAWFALDKLCSSALPSNGSPPDRLWRLIYTLTTSPEEHAALLGSLFWTGVITTAGCSFAESGALAEISAAEATIILSSEPLWGALIARQMLGEVIGVYTVVGACLVVSACVVSACDEAAEVRVYRRLRGAVSIEWAICCSGLRGVGFDTGQGERESLLEREKETA